MHTLKLLLPVITRLLIILAVAILLSRILPGCAKQQDYSYLDTDRRPQVIAIAERFTNPPKAGADGKWVPDTILIHYLPRDVYYGSYVGLKADTNMCNTSSAAYPRFPVDISYYKVKFY
jgi:hypothetical protein